MLGGCPSPGSAAGAGDAARPWFGPKSLLGRGFECFRGCLLVISISVLPRASGGFLADGSWWPPCAATHVSVPLVHLHVHTRGARETGTRAPSKLFETQGSTIMSFVVAVFLTAPSPLARKHSACARGAKPCVQQGRSRAEPEHQGQLGASALIWGAGSKAALSPSASGRRGSPANSSALAFFSAEAEPSSGREASAGPARASSPGRMGLAPAAPGLRGERRGKQPFQGRGF